MHPKQSSLLVWLFGGALAFSLSATAVIAARYVGDGSRQAIVLFDHLPWLLALISAVALIAAALVRRPGDQIEGDRVLRHDGVARLTHWTTAFGCLVLLYTGIKLGFLFVPRSTLDAGETAVMFNLHFVGALFFLFGTLMWLANQFVDRRRARGHLPDESLIEETRKSVVHYLHMAGLSKEHIEAPKYHQSGRLAGLVIIATTAVIILSGFGKLLARGLELSPAITQAINLSHDYATLLMLMLIPVHALLAGLAPWAWKALKSMFTGYVSVDYAKREHAIWYRELKAKQQEKAS